MRLPELWISSVLLVASSASLTFVEPWLSRLDVALPWARKVGGMVCGDSRLFVGESQHDGGAVGLALSGIEVRSRR